MASQTVLAHLGLTSLLVTVWPLHIDGPTGLLTVYEPQSEKFEGDTLTARAAVSLTPAGATDPEFGALWMQARVLTDRDAREATLGVAQKVKEQAQQLQNTPPKIIFAAAPTTLVILDGPPKLQPGDVAGVMMVRSIGGPIRGGKRTPARVGHR